MTYIINIKDLNAEAREKWGPEQSARQQVLATLAVAERIEDLMGKFAVFSIAFLVIIIAVIWAMP